MTEHEVIVELKSYNDSPYDACLSEEGCEMAIKALEAQTKLKEYIERINQPEYDGVVWQKDEVVLLLKELIA